MTALFTLLKEEPLSMDLDSYAINHGGKHTPFAADTDIGERVDRVLVVLAQKRTGSLRMYRGGESQTKSIMLRPMDSPPTARPRDSLKITYQYDRSDRDRSRSLLVEWLKKLLDACDVSKGTADFMRGGGANGAFLGTLYWPLAIEPISSPQLGWLTIWGKEHNDLIPFDELTAALRSQKDQTTTVVLTKSNAILTVSASPDQVPPEPWRVAFAGTTAEIAWRTISKRWKGVDPRVLITKVVGPALKKHGFVRHEEEEEKKDSQEQWMSGRIIFTRREGDLREVELRLENLLPEAMLLLRVIFRSYATTSSIAPASSQQRAWQPPTGARRAAGEDGVTVRFDSEKAARASLDLFLKRFDRDVLPWFDEAAAINAKRAKKSR